VELTIKTEGRYLNWGYERGELMSLGTILIIVLILVLIGVIPTWGHSRAWGYGPSSLIGVVLVIVLILFLLGKI
jgi:Protein of unknown function (DUF3309)